MSPTQLETNAVPETNAAVPGRAAINRANAEHSTGPRTPEGKAKMRFNALQHGLYSETVVLPHEDRSAYQALGRSFSTHFAPRTEEARKLVQTLQDTEWRLGRILSLESGILAIGTADNLDAVEEKYGPLDDLTRQTIAQAAGFLANSRALDQLSRHEARLLRLFQKTERELRDLAAQRPARPAAPSARVGSVPHAAPPPAPPVAPPDPPALPSRPKTPKFSGPMRKQHRKEWLRAQARKNEAPATS